MRDGNFQKNSFSIQLFPAPALQVRSRIFRFLYVYHQAILISARPGPAALMFVLVGRALDRLYIEDDEEDETDQGPDKKQAPSASDAAEVSS